MPQQRPSIAVVGAGPAGLTLACVMARRGWAATVFERDAGPEARDRGGTLDLHPGTGQAALAAAGLLDAFLAAARRDDQDSCLLDHATGAELFAERPAPGEGERPEIDRGALCDLLRARLPADAVRWGRRLDAVRPEPDGRHRLCFACGAGESFDLVVGADGAWSRVRRALTDEEPAPTGMCFVELHVADADRRRPNLARLVGRGSLFALHAGAGIVAQRNGGGALRVYAALRAPEAELRGLLDRGGLAALARRFPGWAPALLALIEGADAAVAVRPIASLAPGRGWPHRRGLTLIGDAAHLMPPVGVGANLALADAADLAAALTEAPDWAEGVARAERALMARAAALGAEAREGFADMFAADAPRGVLEHMRGRGPAAGD